MGFMCNHSYSIPTSFLHHSYIIHTSFLHPSYIIHTSFTHHSYILPLPVPLDDRDQRRRALQWAKGGQRFGKGIRHKFPNGRVGAAEVGRSGGRGDGVQQHAHAHDAVGRRHGTGQPAQPTEKPTTVTVGQGRLKICLGGGGINTETGQSVWMYHGTTSWDNIIGHGTPMVLHR